MIVGESHYLPPKSPISKQLNNWCSLNESKLNEDEQEYTNTSKIIGNNIVNNFSNKAYAIYRNVCKVINEISFNYDNSAKIMDHLGRVNTKSKGLNC